MCAQSWNVMLVSDLSRLQILVEVLTFAPKRRNHEKSFFFQHRSYTCHQTWAELWSIIIKYIAIIQIHQKH